MALPQWQAPTPEELKMTSLPEVPGAAAVEHPIHTKPLA